MKFKSFTELLCRGVSSFDIDLESSALSSLYYYFEELQRWNKKVNLISKDTGELAIVENHFIDSLVLLTQLDETYDNLFDIGSGAGFPGLVCKIARPQMPVGLVEPRLKRVSFLRHVIRSCRIEKITVYPVRLEHDVGFEDEPMITCVVSRAVTDIAHFLEMCERFRVDGTRVICMKGPKYRQELMDQSTSGKRWELSDLYTYRLPFSGASRALLCYTPRL